MNKFSILIALCTVILLSCNQVRGQDPDPYTQIPDADTEQARSWRVFGAMTKRPGDSPLFVVDDIFNLARDAGNSGNVLFKPVNMNNPGWRENGNPRTIVFRRYPASDTVQYLCAVEAFQGDHHLIAISAMAEQPEDQIVIQYMHAENANPNQCTNLTLASHGGLAHAHAVR